jgi:hypothetical protein
VDIVLNHGSSDSAEGTVSVKDNVVKNQIRFNASVPGLLLSLVLICFINGSQSVSADDSQHPTKDGIVYVCACLKTKSCFCMTEAKMKGPCACGTEGGPPMKAVASDSDWAKQNREALAK